MQFLKTLFWVVLAVALLLFASENWSNVTMRLWGGLSMDVKLPVLVLITFLIGFLPPFLIYRARLWSLKRRLDGSDRQTVFNAPGAAVPERPVQTSAPGEPAA